MPLSITSRPDRNFQVITLTGNLTLGPHLKTVQQTVRSVLESASPDGLVLDVAGIKYADSAGLGELTVVYTLCTQRKCVLILVGVPHQLRQMLDLTRLDALLPAAADIEAAKRMVKARSPHKNRESAETEEPPSDSGGS
jgi:anti-anti-sigma factor